MNSRQLYGDGFVLQLPVLYLSLVLALPTLDFSGDVRLFNRDYDRDNGCYE
jgi:hypothetical protein